MKPVTEKPSSRISTTTAPMNLFHQCNPILLAASLARRRRVYPTPQRMIISMVLLHQAQGPQHHRLSQR
jgi:hypothetical protein